MIIKMAESSEKWMWEKFDKFDKCMTRNEEICESLANDDFSLSCEEHEKYNEEYDESLKDFAYTMYIILKNRSKNRK